MTEGIEARVIAIIAEQALLDPSDIAATTRLDEIGIDSLGLAESIFAIEEAFDIHVPFNANEPSAGDFDISTVASIVSGIEGLVAARS